MILLILNIIYSSSFEFGITPEDKMNVYLPEFWSEAAANKVSFYFNLETKIEIKKFYIGGGIKTFAGKSISDAKEFVPYKATYKFMTGFEFDKFEIGFRHYCIHPVVPYITFDNPAIFHGAYEELYIRFSTK